MGLPTPTRRVVRIGRPRRSLSPATATLLRTARKDAGLTQTALAAKTVEVARAVMSRRAIRSGMPQPAGVSQPMISALECGHRAPSIRTARLLIRALELRFRDPLRRGLLASVSPSRKVKRRLRAKVKWNPALRTGTRAAGAAVKLLGERVGASEARRQRQVGVRTGKGGKRREAA